MTRFMEWAEGSGIETPGTDLPPREITSEVLARMLDEAVPEHFRQPTIIVAHYGFGAAVACLYPLAMRVIPIRSAVIQGMAFGLQVWVVSYLGLLPIADSVGRAGNRTFRVNGTMILAHLIWGTSVGVISKCLQSQCQPEQKGEATRCI
ncbi:DUF1440 domain-containing protein [Anatilimnocola sp. NA78]|uniref:DUF1440 domain-containing protein n=1 Tax=Anatilimnocola sp. NA78 TaxID=3415683 RepID=UPI003CE53762